MPSDFRFEWRPVEQPRVGDLLLLASAYVDAFFTETVGHYPA